MSVLNCEFSVGELLDVIGGTAWAQHTAKMSG
jgi:hypothetical protein